MATTAWLILTSVRSESRPVKWTHVTTLFCPDDHVLVGGGRVLRVACCALGMSALCYWRISRKTDVHVQFSSKRYGPLHEIKVRKKESNSAT